MTRLFWLLMLVTLALPARAVTPVPWLYEVSVPVENQGGAERRRASSDALLTMLRRATGLAFVPRSEPVREALDDPESYYNEFSFAQDEEGALMLVVQFDPSAVLALQKRADLPIWRSARERVVAWLVVDGVPGAPERRLLGADNAGPVGEALLAAARERGVELILPLLDLEDQLAVTPAAVWGRLSRVLEDASRRYGADVVLVGRLASADAGEWQSDWEFWLPDAVVSERQTGPDLPAQGAAVVARLADELAGRAAVLGSGSNMLTLAVTGIRSPADYAALLDYLSSLEFVDRVALETLAGDRLELALATRADAAQLLTLFEADRLLFSDRLAGYDGTDLRLVWRQR